MISKSLCGILIVFFFLGPSVSALVQSVDITAVNPQFITFLKTNDIVAFEYRGVNYEAHIAETTEDYLTLEVRTVSHLIQRFHLIAEDQRDIDLDADLESDVTFFLKQIQNGRSTLTIINIPKMPSPPQQPEQTFTPEEKEAADSSLQKFLQATPTLTTGLLYLNGKVSFFRVAQDYGIFYGIQAVSQHDPEAGAAIQAFQALQKMGAALQPAGSPEQLTGSSIHALSGKVLAAWDGHNTYYRFKLLPSVSKDISPLFKEGSVYAKNIQVTKDFSDRLLTITLLPYGSVDVNTRLFVNLNGDMKLAESDAQIHNAELVARKSNTNADFTLSPHPFVAFFRANGQLSYSADANTLTVNRASVRFAEPTYTLRLPASNTAIDDADVTLAMPSLPQPTALTTTDKSKISFTLQRTTMTPAIHILHTTFPLEGEHPPSVSTPQGLLSASGGNISSSVSLPGRIVSFFTSPVFILRDGTNAISFSTLKKELQHFEDIYARSPESVKKKFF